MTNTSSTFDISVVIAGSTHHTLLCAQALDAHDAFRISGIITPQPKPSGRKKEIKKNPLHVFAEKNAIPTILIEKKIDEHLHEQLQTEWKQPHILLVVDFGFLVPPWLLSWPRIAPINIHPSDLPKFRGSSPGQFVLLFGEKASAITLIRMDEKLDHGSIVAKVFFDVAPSWTAPAYYAHAFALIAQELPELLSEFAKNPHEIAPQPDESPTPTARMLSREDGFIPFETLQQILRGEKPSIPISFLANYQRESTAQNVFNLWRAFTPWPGIWTTVGGSRKQTRVKLLEFSWKGKTLTLKTIQVEGKKLQTYKEGMLENL